MEMQWYNEIKKNIDKYDYCQCSLYICHIGSKDIIDISLIQINVFMMMVWILTQTNDQSDANQTNVNQISVINTQIKFGNRPN